MEDNSSTAFRTKFLRLTRQGFSKNVLNKPSRNGFVVMGYEECCSKFYVAPTFQVLLENCHRLDLDTCVRRLVTKNGEFEGPQ